MSPITERRDMKNYHQTCSDFKQSANELKAAIESTSSAFFKMVFEPQKHQQSRHPQEQT